MEEKTSIKLKCFFCFLTDFELPYEDYEPKHGEQLICSNCGRSNDYDSLLLVAKKKGKEWTEQQVKSEMDKLAKKLSRMFK